MTDDATTTAATTAGRTPWWFWLAGALSLLWNGFGAYDYLMTHLNGAAYLAGMGMTEAQVGYFQAMPAWMTAVWAVGVWGAVLGSVLLLLRMKWALHAFVVSGAAFALSLVYAYLLSEGGAIMGVQGTVMNAVIGAACLVFIWYAFAMTKRGLLR